jgi:hypothetical protein
MTTTTQPKPTTTQRLDALGVSQADRLVFIAIANHFISARRGHGPSRSGFAELKELAELTANGTVANVRGVIIRNRVALESILSGTAKMYKGSYSRSGSGAFGRYSNVRGHYSPAAVSISLID